VADIISASGVDGGDDLFGVDALQVDAGRAEAGVAGVPLDHVERDAFAGEFDGMRVAELVRREAAPDTRLGGESAELEAARWRSSMAARGSGRR
jgi:hypothetical protein